jgi:hypothetical protein
VAETSSITFRPPLRDVRGRFATATEQLVKDKRNAARKLGQRWVAIAREEAPNKTGNFSKSIRFRTYQKGAEIGFTTTSLQPLGRWITEGTRPHQIAPRMKNALYFFWPRIGKFVVVPRGGGFKTHTANGKLWVGKGHINHPGTKPNPYIDRTYIRWENEMDRELNQMASRYAVNIVGKK